MQVSKARSGGAEAGADWRLTPVQTRFTLRGAFTLVKTHYLALKANLATYSHQREDPSLVGKAFGVGKGVLTVRSPHFLCAGPC